MICFRSKRESLMQKTIQKQTSSDLEDELDNDMLYQYLYDDELEKAKERVRKLNFIRKEWLLFSILHEKWSFIEWILVSDRYDLDDLINDFESHLMDIQRSWTKSPLLTILEKEFDKLKDAIYSIIEVCIQTRKDKVLHFLSKMQTPTQEIRVERMDICSYYVLEIFSSPKFILQQADIVSYVLASPSPAIKIDKILDKSPSFVFEYFYSGDKHHRKQFQQLLENGSVPTCMLVVTLLDATNPAIAMLIEDISKFGRDSLFVFQTCHKMSFLSSLHPILNKHIEILKNEHGSIQLIE